MNRFLATALMGLFCVCNVMAQIDDNSMDGFTVTDNTFNPNRALDSLKTSHKTVPKGMHMWTIDGNFGDMTPQVPDTAQHLVMNTIFTEGLYGEYNTTGNLGSPRLSRIATDRDFSPRMAFLEPYGYFITKPSELRFTNTLSPITDLYYNSCGNKTNGEDHIKALFATNINKEAGFGFKFDYLYGRGYYQNQSGAYFDYTMWGSYIGQRYQAHLIMSFDHMKTTENGGIADDEYVTHPEAQSDTYASDETRECFQIEYDMDNYYNIFPSIVIAGDGLPQTPVAGSPPIIEVTLYQNYEIFSTAQVITATQVRRTNMAKLDHAANTLSVIHQRDGGSHRGTTHKNHPWWKTALEVGKDVAEIALPLLSLAL